jgi:hypothetical protein
METFISGGTTFITGNGVNNITALGVENTFSEGVRLARRPGGRTAAARS